MSPLRSVLITGGAQRLGAELVRAFSAAGWVVWCHYHRSEAQANALRSEMIAQGRDVRLVQADLGDVAAMTGMMEAIANSDSPLRAVVNNASLFEPDVGTQISVSQARQQFEVNLLTPMLLGQMLAQQLNAHGDPDGCVIHILDQKVFNLNPDYFSYTLSKLALERAVGLQAQALAPRVRVCGVAPGLMYLSGPQSQENFALASTINLRQRATDPVDVAKTCLFLAITESITGTTICVDNGQHLVPLTRDVMFIAQDKIQQCPTRPSSNTTPHD